jgi:hypothetical protein
MRARTQLLRAIGDRRKAVAGNADEATVKKLNEALAEAQRNARQAGLTPTAIMRLQSTPSDVYMFGRLPEADQRAMLRQADDKEFERYITHARMGIRGPMRLERADKQTEAPAPVPRSTPAPRAAASTPSPPIVPAPAPASPPRSAPTAAPPRGRSRADQLLQTSPAIGR